MYLRWFSCFFGVISLCFLWSFDSPTQAFEEDGYLKATAVPMMTLVTEKDIKLVLLDCELSPSQERNLEIALCARVLDRTGLILDIFATRAQSDIGKLQVELAQLSFLSTRLDRGWSHLERQ